MVDFLDTPAEAEFRKETREFIKRFAPPPGVSTAHDQGGEDPGARAAYAKWRDALAERNWIAAHWPPEYGGAGLSHKEQFILGEELAEYGTGNVGGFGVMMLGPTLIVHGTDEQRNEQLPRILRGEMVWCQGWSEPGAGSDLASLQTRAVRDGDEYVINGQKIWTSGAQHSNAMYMLARTDPEAPKHRGISFLMFEMSSPGVSLRPLTTMAGIESFNEVFFEDVHVPTRNLVGEENRGWYVGMTLTDFERSGIGSAVNVERRLRRLLREARETSESMLAGDERAQAAPLRHAFADAWIQAQVAKLFAYRIITMMEQQRVPNYEGSMAKLYLSELNQHIGGIGIRIFGLYGQLLHPIAPAETDVRRTVARDYLQAVSATIAGGTSEILRNIIATRGLQLPRG